MILYDFIQSLLTKEFIYLIMKMIININMNSLHHSWLKLLGDSGYRLTRPRIAVVQTLTQTNHALNPTQIFFKAHQQCNSLGLVTVYRTLEKLEELHLIQRVYLQDGNYGFFPQSEGHHHLLICKQCNRTEVFSGDELLPLFLKLNMEMGFEVKDHWLQLIGICASCKENSLEK